MAVAAQRNAAAFGAAGAFRAAAVGVEAEAGAVASAPPHKSAPGQQALMELADGPYFVLAAWLDVAALCSVDAACRRLLFLNGVPVGPWRELGRRTFEGLELQEEGQFEIPEEMEDERRLPDRGPRSRKHVRIHWKGRYLRFRSRLSTFSLPYSSSDIRTVSQPDEVAYFRCRLCTDILSKASTGLYLEVEIRENPDNLSMAVVDFEAGGCSSVTFSPDTGAVIRERKVRESPRKVQGAYIQPLGTLAQGERFHGFVGLYLHDGNLAFFRRSAAAGDESGQLGPWESTGFITDLLWATGRRLTPCLAFRSEGAYYVRIAHLGSQPPLPCDCLTTLADGDQGWSSLDWEVDADDAVQGEAQA